MMGFLLKPLSTVTSMCEVSGGALYLRPCCSGVVESSWARAQRGANETRSAKRQRAILKREARREWVRRGLRSSICTFYARRAAWVGLEWCAGRLWSIRYDMSDFHSDFTPDWLTD